MTLPTGSRRDPSAEPEGRRGFTLIELILVMALLTIVMALASPQLAGFFRGRSIDSEARRFVSLTRYAQSRAVSEGAPMVLWIDEKERTYGMEMQPGFDRYEDGKAVEFKLGKDIEVEPETVPNGLQTAGISRSSRESTRPVFGNLPTLIFMPDGFVSGSSPDNITLRDADKSEIRIGLSRNGLHYEIITNDVRRTRIRR